MNVYEMEGFLRGKCLPGDMKVNESNAQYLVRKFSEFESNLSESQREFRAADATIHNLELKLTDIAVQLANAESKCRELAAENAAMKQNAVQAEKVIMSSKFDYWSDRVELSAVVGRIIETPATDAFLAEVRASELDSLAGVAETMLVKFSNQRCSQDMHEVVGWKMVLQQASNRAAQLRKGAAL